jgi:glycosyltransferase involved in cell wall biosynthesis
MRKVCIVNNYNYDKYLLFCLDSVVNQSVQFDVIYVVDDGSTDESRAIIAKYAKKFQEVIPLFKENEGQLSCFNFVYDYITEDDFVWFIDSDDYYPPDYVERFLIETSDSKSDFFFCKTVKFSTDAMIPKTSKLGAQLPVEIGVSAELTRLTRCWIGGPTSSIVISGRLFKDIFPYPYVSNWKSYADEILVFAASIGGYSKTYLPSLCFGYRVHGANRDYGQVFGREHRKKRVKSRDVLIAWYSKKYDLEERIKFANILDEYNSISAPQYRKTFSISMQRLIKKYLIITVTYYSKSLFGKYFLSWHDEGK